MMPRIHPFGVLEGALGGIELAPGSGPGYLIEGDAAFPASAPLVRPDAEDLTDLRAANPGNWGVDEWQDLLDGRPGPWVIARRGDQVISICHTPASSARAAEAGVWTHPESRRQGHAAPRRPNGRRPCARGSRFNRARRSVGQIYRAGTAVRRRKRGARGAARAAYVGAVPGKEYVVNRRDA